MTGGPRQSDLMTRVWSAVILAPVVLWLIWLGSWPFLLLVWLVSVLVFWEWTRLSRVEGGHILLVIAALALAGILSLFVTQTVTWAFAATLVAAFCLIILARAQRGWAGAGFFYAAVPMLAYAGLRLGDNGLLAIGYVLGVVWATDILAYFSGRAIGGPKIWTAISPKKTWAGLIGGSLGAAGFGAVLASMAGLSVPHLAAIAAMMAIVAQIGDFVESAVKRRFNVKDSSHLIPGHGGLMDRVDGLAFAAIMAMAIGIGRSGGDIATGLLRW